MSGLWEEFVATLGKIIASVLAAATSAVGAPGAWAASAAAAPKVMCVSNDEAVAFRLRHLQSRLMVAGLSCGQKDAYNAFATNHKPTLATYGPYLLTYYKRAGGPTQLNRYVTDLANAVASIRSDDPEAFCNHTWTVFWELEQDPQQLLDLAAANPVPAISQPAPCAVPAERPKVTGVSTAPQSAAVPSQKKTAAP